MRIALVGLAASEVLIVKNYLKKYAEELDVTWTGIKEKDFDVLIVRARFLETPEVENLILNSGEHVTILSVYRDDKFGSEAINRNIPSLKVPSHDKEDIIEWVSHIGKVSYAELVQDGSEESGTSVSNEAEQKRQAAIEKGLAKLSATGARFSNASEHDQRATSHGANGQRKTDETSVIKHFVNQSLLKAVKNKEDVLVVAGELKTWIKTDQRRVFTNYKLDDMPSFDDFEWSPFDFTALPTEAKQQTELNQWLWESLWKSRIDFTTLVDNHSQYQLKRWPQPKSRAHRTEPLRIAAHIQKKAMTVGEMSQLTLIDEAVIKKFVYTMQVVGFVKKTKADPARQIVEPLHTKENQDVDESKLTLLKRIRSRLGLKGTP